MGMSPRSQAKTARLETTPSALVLMDAFGAFIRAYKGWMRSLLGDLSSSESNPSRAMLVMSLRRASPQPMGSLAAHLGLPKSNITALVDDLEAEGVLRRMQDAKDRRVTQLELTAKGRTLCEDEYDAYERNLASLFDMLPPEERVPMLSALERMTGALREKEGGGAEAEKPSEAPRLAARAARAKAKATASPVARAVRGTKSFRK